MSAWEERDDDLESQLNRSALWAITYGDLMSYLMIFFLIMFIGASTKSVSIQMSLKAVEQLFGGRTNELVSQLAGAGPGLQQIAKIEIRENKMRMVFAEPVLFAAGSADLKPESFGHLQRVADALRELPNSIQIEGHTDDRPLGSGAKFKSNWELSAARAFSVLRFLEISGIPSQRLSAIGYGQQRPLKSNDTPENRSANRRTEINIVRIDE